MTESEIKAECERLARKAWPWEADCEDPLSVSIGPDSRVWHPFEEDSCGIRLTHPERAPQALLAALRVLANEPDPRDAEIEQLRSRLAEAESRLAEWEDARCQGAGDTAEDWLDLHAEGFDAEGVPLAMNHAKIIQYQLAYTEDAIDSAADAKAASAICAARAWKRLAKQLRVHHRNALHALGESIARCKRLDGEARTFLERADAAAVQCGLTRKQLDGMTAVADHRAEELRKLRDGVRRIADDFARNECDADEYNKCSWGHAAARLVALLGEE